MADKKHILIYAGLKQYGDELQNLEVVKRKEVAQEIEEAKEQGDLSGNAEYDMARDEQRDIEPRIEELEKLLKSAEVMIEDEIDLDEINIGCKVKLLDVKYDEEMGFYVVGFTGANSLQNRISNESLVSRTLIGKVMGGCVDVETQAGDIQYKVLEIQGVSQRTRFKNRRT